MGDDLAGQEPSYPGGTCVSCHYSWTMWDNPRIFNEGMPPSNGRGTVEYSLGGHARMPRRFSISNSSLSHRLPCVVLSFIGSPFLLYLSDLRKMMDGQCHERGSLQQGYSFGPLTSRLVFERARRSGPTHVKGQSSERNEPYARDYG